MYNAVSGNQFEFWDRPLKWMATETPEPVAIFIAGHLLNSETNMVVDISNVTVGKI